MILEINARFILGLLFIILGIYILYQLAAWAIQQPDPHYRYAVGRQGGYMPPANTTPEYTFFPPHRRCGNRPVPRGYYN